MASRNPKELRQMVADSQQDVSDMQTNLAKLRSLSADDKTEAALLRSRIDEQSQLIMILKQRSDEHYTKVTTLERINADLEEFRDHAEEQLEAELRKFNMLEARFSDLASNHEELIKFKDEYKRQNDQLRAENQRLHEDNKRLFSKAIEERNAKINDLERRAINMKEQIATLDSKYKDTQQVLSSTEEKYSNEVRTLQKKLNDSEERLKGSQAKLLQETDSKQKIDGVAQIKIQQLTKEKDELLNLAMQRGKLIQEKQSENKLLEKRILDMEKSVKNMQEKFEREAAAVNASLQVRKLREELEEADERSDEVTKEFEAYKKHSTYLLQKERDLNTKLRHLVG